MSAELKNSRLREETSETASVSAAVGRYNRVGILDTLRGTAIIFVMIYHLLYDLIFFAGKDIPFFFSEGMDMIHNFFLTVLFLVSGICAGFSGHVLKRGAELFLMGEILTLATAAFFPDELIVFGVLSCFGMSMLIYGIISPVMKKLPQLAVFAVFAALSTIFFNFHRDGSLFFIIDSIKLDLPRNIYHLYPIGITSAGFRSADYFPLIPYGFIFLAGTGLSGSFAGKELPEFLYKINLPIVNFCGKYSLWLYIIHQPLFLAITYFM